MNYRPEIGDLKSENGSGRRGATGLQELKMKMRDGNAFNANGDGHADFLAEVPRRSAPSPDTDAIVGDSSFSERVGRLRREFPEALDVPICEEIFDFMADEGWLNGAAKTVTASDAAWKTKFIKILAFLYQHHKTPHMYAALAIWDVDLLDDIYGHRTQREFADSIGLTRAAVNKAVKEAQKYFGTAPRRDQRKFEACNNMRNRRLTQLKK